jgi:hypothetical protein
MKTVKMIKTMVCKNTSGVNQVYGPPGKEFSLDNKIADNLIKEGAAKDVKPVVAVEESTAGAVSE